MKQYSLAIAAIFTLTAAAEIPLNGPLPAPKPQTEKIEPKEQKATPPPDADVPVPIPETDTQTTPPAPQDKPPIPTEENSKDTSSPPEPEDMAAYRQCLSDLKELGATFTEAGEVDAEGACGMEKPLKVTGLGNAIKLEPEATIRCETALALTRWVRHSAEPAAKIAFPERRITVITNASGYVCRNRNSAENGKVSEHALGNAIDIAAITFENGDALQMKTRAEITDMEGALLRTITASACLFFTTVLSPGSDETHQDHMHLDVMGRKNGYRLCQ